MHCAATARAQKTDYLAVDLHGISASTLVCVGRFFNEPESARCSFFPAEGVEGLGMGVGKEWARWSDNPQTARVSLKERSIVYFIEFTGSCNQNSRRSQCCLE